MPQVDGGEPVDRQHGGRHIGAQAVGVGHQGAVLPGDHRQPAQRLFDEFRLVAATAVGRRADDILEQVAERQVREDLARMRFVLRGDDGQPVAVRVQGFDRFADAGAASRDEYAQLQARIALFIDQVLHLVRRALSEYQGRRGEGFDAHAD